MSEVMMDPVTGIIVEKSPGFIGSYKGFRHAILVDPDLETTDDSWFKLCIDEELMDRLVKIGEL